MKSGVAKRLLAKVVRDYTIHNGAHSVIRISGSTSNRLKQHVPSAQTSASAVRWFSSSKDDDDSKQDKQIVSEDYDENDDYEDDFDDMAYSTFDEEFDDDEYRHSNRRNKSKQRDDDDQEEEEGPQRIWLDPNTKLEDRVEKFLSRKLGTMHPLDIRLASVDLIRESGKLNSFEGMKFAHDILDRILEEKRFVNQNEDGRESVIFVAERPFQVLMYGWSNLSRKVSVAPQRMREVLDLMIQEAEYDDQTRQELRARGNISEEMLESLPSCQPTVDIYNTLLQGLVQASFRSIAAAGEAEAVLNVMIKKNRKHGWHTKPNTKSFTFAMTAFVKTQHSTAGKRAEAILRRMIEYHEAEMELYHEETGTEYNLNDPSSNRRRIVTPDTIAYTAVIQAYAASNSPGSAEKARDLLAELLESDHPSLVPDAFVFANTINAYAKLASKKKSPGQRLQAAEEAEELVWLMVDQLTRFAQVPEEEEEEDMQADTVEDAPTKKIQTGQSNPLSSVVPFNACLNAWAESNAPGSAIRAEELLHKMLDPEFVETTGILPNTTSFNTCMQAWAKASRFDSSAPAKAEELLSLLTSSNDENMKADITSYSTVMTAYAKSNRPDKAVHTRRLLELLLDSPNVQLSAVPFTIVLNAVAHSPSPYDDTTESSSSSSTDQDDAFGTDDSGSEDDPYGAGRDAYSIALMTYMELQEDMYDLNIYPDHLVYATMLDVITKHTDAESIERRQRMEQVFEDACAAGHVSSLVVASLQKACNNSPDLLQEMLQVSDPTAIQSVNALPRAWTRRVPPRFRKLKGSEMVNSKRRRNNNNRKKGKKGKRKDKQ